MEVVQVSSIQTTSDCDWTEFGPDIIIGIWFINIASGALDCIGNWIKTFMVIDLAFGADRE